MRVGAIEGAVPAWITAAFVLGSPAWAQESPPSPHPVEPGVISTPSIEHGFTVSSDGRTAWFTRRQGAWGTSQGRSTIYRSEWSHDGWAASTVAHFSGEHQDSDPFVSPDGRELFFTSDRPAPGGHDVGRDIWVVRLDEGSHATHVAELSSPADEYSPVLVPSGRLYFASAREGGLGQGDLYVADRRPAGFQNVRNLGSAVNSPFGEWNVLVSPDEQVLVLEASSRALNRSVPGDLYVSFRDGPHWTRSVALADLNTSGSDLMPRLSADGSTLYYASSMTLDGTHTDVFSVPFDEVLARARSALQPVLMAVSRSAHHVAVVDPNSLEVVGRSDTNPGPHEVAAGAEGLAVTADFGLFPSPHDEPVSSHPGFAPQHPTGNTLTVVDVGESAVSRVELSDCARTHGIDASRDGSLVWATCEEEGAVVEVDVASAQVVRRWDTDQVGSHRVLATDDDRYLIVANVGPGSVTVIDRQNGSVAVLDTGEGSEGMDVAPDGTVWVATSGENNLVQVDPRTRQMLQTVASGGTFPISVSIDAERNHAWVAHMGTRSIDVIDLSSGEPVDRIELPSAPLRVLVVPGVRHAYASLPRENRIAVLDRAARSVVGYVEDIMEVDGLVWLEVPPGS